MADRARRHRRPRQAPDVSKQVEPKLQGIKDALLYGYRIETGGSIEESVKAGALVAVFPVMAIVMLAFLMSSCRPAPRAGVRDRAARADRRHRRAAHRQRPFGFVALLGLIARRMIMRNTVILVDQIDRDIAAGHGRHHAIISATVRRARPVCSRRSRRSRHDPARREHLLGPMAITIMGGLFVATVLTPGRQRSARTVPGAATRPSMPSSNADHVEHSAGKPVRIAAE
jgi:multidrug efflux pump subunit AcrB